MTIDEYEILTGITVATTDEARITAMIARTEKILENMLGFTLDTDLVDENQYIELGKTKTDTICPCDIDIANLDPADSVIYAYRLFSYNVNDKYFFIDPCTEIHAIKLVINDVTVKTLVEFEDYRVDVKNGLIRFVEKLGCWCSDLEYYNHVQLAIDADWAWPDNIPLDLQYIWADMITSYSDCSDNIKSESLGPHSYTKFDNVKPESKSENLSIIKKYSGPNGSVNRTITL